MKTSILIYNLKYSMHNKILKNTFSIYAMNIAKPIIPLITLPYLTRILTKDCYGIVSYVKAVMWYMQLIVDFGFMLSGTKDIVHAKNEFPKGMLYEDLATIYKMIVSCKTIVYIDCPIYHYLHRNGSTYHSKYSQKVVHVMWATENLPDSIDKNYSYIHSAGVHRYFCQQMNFMPGLLMKKNF